MQRNVRAKTPLLPPSVAGLPRAYLGLSADTTPLQTQKNQNPSATTLARKWIRVGPHSSIAPFLIRILRGSIQMGYLGHVLLYLKQQGILVPSFASYLNKAGPKTCILLRLKRVFLKDVKQPELPTILMDHSE